MKHTVFNSHLDLFAKRYIENASPYPLTKEYTVENQRQKMLGVLAEQFLLFDSIGIKTDRNNYPLLVLINELGLNAVEELLTQKAIKLILWTPIIATSTGRQLPNGKMDESPIYGMPPIIVGQYSEEDSDPENNIDKALKRLNIHSDRKKIFKKIALENYILPDNSIAGKSKDIILDAYEKNRLVSFGFNSNKDSSQLNGEERIKLLELGNEILETSLIAEKKMKSYDNYAYFNLTMDSVKYIEGALKVSENTSKIFQVQNLPDIQALFRNQTLSLDQILELRNKPVTFKYRNWINEISADTNAYEITKAYTEEITGKNKFFESVGGKFLRTVGMFGVGTGMGVALSGGIPGIAIGAIGGKAADLGLSLFDTYVLDGLLKGWNPKMFVDEIDKNIKK